MYVLQTQHHFLSPDPQQRFSLTGHCYPDPVHKVMEFTLYSPINLACRNIDFAVCNLIGMGVST